MILWIQPHFLDELWMMSFFISVSSTLMDTTKVLWMNV